jgi:hypothetical protein
MATSRAEIESLSEASAFAWAQASHRAESGIGQILKQAPGFRGYYVFQDGNGVGCSITLFENRADALAATLSTTSAAAGIAAERVAARVRRVIFV